MKTKHQSTNERRRRKGVTFLRIILWPQQVLLYYIYWKHCQRYIIFQCQWSSLFKYSMGVLISFIFHTFPYCLIFYYFRETRTSKNKQIYYIYTNLLHNKFSYNYFMCPSYKYKMLVGLLSFGNTTIIKYIYIWYSPHQLVNWKIKLSFYM